MEYAVLASNSNCREGQQQGLGGQAPVAVAAEWLKLKSPEHAAVYVGWENEAVLAVGHGGNASKKHVTSTKWTAAAPQTPRCCCCCFYLLLLLLLLSVAAGCCRIVA